MHHLRVSRIKIKGRCLDRRQKDASKTDVPQAASETRGSPDRHHKGVSKTDQGQWAPASKVLL